MFLTTRKSAIVVVRQLEPLNLFLGWEQANRYQLLSPEGHLLGYLLEEETSIAGTMSRQFLRNHRPFKATVISPDGEVLLRIHRPFAWINSRIYVSTPTSGSSTARDAKEEMQRLEAPSSSSSSASTALTTRQVEAEHQDDGELIGESQQEWHIYRRRYNHFVKRGDEMIQFANTDAGFLAWDFSVRDEEGKVVGSINRNFAGFARELFTDTGHYVIRFEGVVDELNPRLEAPAPSGMLPSPGSSAPSTALTPSSAASSNPPIETPPSLPLDRRAVLLATAVTADIDYFSRQRGGLMGGGGMFMPIPIPMGGMSGGAAGEAGEAAAAAEEASEAAVPQAGRIPGADGEGPLPSTEFEEDEFAVRNRPEGVPRGEDGVVPGAGAGQGWGQEEVMQDPWASEAPQEGGTWTWGDLWGDDSGGGGGRGGGDWGGDGDW
ncbi:scramblase family protein [Rhodotorula toruloides]|uniref:Phospholipid scramblase n=1 Tax=Rhodotorula toruloides TaxID=5286 RepID=A0A511K8R4_RHOTO|nr:scramblase family protein [Rhodotorula toruloides]